MIVEKFTGALAAAAWLTPPKDAPWQWDEEGETIVWSDGGTVVFREELARIIETLPSQALPRAGAIILLLAACRGKTPAAAGWPAHLGPVAEGLRRIAALPAELIRGVANHAVLIHNLIGHLPARPAINVAPVLDLLRSGQPLSEMLEADEHATFVDDAAVLIAPLAKLDSAALEMLLRTGLPGVPDDPGEPEVPSAIEIGAFVEALLSDPDLAAIAKVARQIMAAISLPEALSHEQDDSLGGFSDIGNRGPLHRLLLSELAHDDDTLSARIALNEALYLRREPAADHPLNRLVLLVDTGLRMWGIPRLFATATALAFLAKGGKYRRPEVFRTARGQAAVAKLWTKEGLLEHLQALDTGLDPSAMIATLAAAPEEKSELRSEIVVITHRATLEDPAFLRALRAANAGNGAQIYAVGVDREGALLFEALGPHGVKPLKEATINLADLFAAREINQRTWKLRDPAAVLPAIFSEKPFPFLLPVDLPIELGWATKKGGICLTQAGNLWHWDHGRRGAVQLSAIAMRGKTVGLVSDESGQNWYAIKHRSNESRVDITHWRMPQEDPGRLQFHSVKVDPQPPLRAFVRGGWLYVVWPDRVCVLSAETLQKVGEGKLPGGTRLIGTHFHGVQMPGCYGMFFWNGSELKFVTLAAVRKINMTEAVLVFDRPGHDGPWVVTKGGQVCSVSDPAPEGMTLKGGPVHAAEPSPDGNSLWVRIGDHAEIVDLVAKTTRQHYHKVPFQHMMSGAAFPYHWSMRTKFTHIGLSPAGQVAIRSAKGEWVMIALDDGVFKFTRDPSKNRLATGPAAWSLTQVTEFGKGDEEEWKPGLALRVARWADGSRAYLDPRGLLHLQSRDIAVPEVSFMLAESRSLPVWSSDGRKTGPGFFIGDHAVSPEDAAAVDGHLRQFVGKILA